MFVNNFEREFERRLKSCLRHIKVESQGFRLVYQASKNMVVAKSSDQICIKFAGLKIIINSQVCRPSGLHCVWPRTHLSFPGPRLQGNPPEVLLSFVAARASGGLPFSPFHRFRLDRSYVWLAASLLFLTLRRLGLGDWARRSAFGTSALGV